MAKSKKVTDLEICAARLRAIWLSKKKQLQLTQKTAAAAIGISQGAFNQYIKGTIPLNVEFAVAGDGLTHLGVFKKISQKISVTLIDFKNQCY